MTYTCQRFVFLTLEPVHVGAGGYRLGRVDMTIVREPGTDLPKIPGTTLAGAARSYAAALYGKPEAAGQQRDLPEEAKRSDRCPILYTFGTTTGEGGRAGTVSIGDARLLLFPVRSASGPLWVSTLELLEGAWGAGAVKLPGGFDPGGDGVATALPTTALVRAGDGRGRLNLGWLLLDAWVGLAVTPPPALGADPAWAAVRDRLAVVGAKLFTHLVSNHLEVRTSVSIDPGTGAASEGALFTYEALPRGTWLWCDVVEDDYRRRGGAWAPGAVTRQVRRDEDKTQDSPATARWEENAGEPLYPDARGQPLAGRGWNRPLDVVRAGWRAAEHLGIGGMGTRGFGRLRPLADWELKGEEAR